MRRINEWWVVSFRRNGIYSPVEYEEVKANSAQEAVDYARFDMNVYQVCGVYKNVKTQWT